jgi:hypothetical protein
VLTADVRFEGWTATDWRRFLHLWKPRALREEEEPTRPRGGVVAIHDGKSIRKVLHTAKGRVDPPVAPEGEPRVSLAELAAMHRTSWGLAAEFGALDEVMERFGARARRSDDFTDQALNLVHIVREMIDEGSIESWPRRLKGVPIPTRAMVGRTIDTLCAEDHAIVLGMFDEGELWTAFVARRRGPSFDVIAGPDELRPAMGLLSGDWRRDYRHLVRAVEERYGALSFGCFGEVESFRALQVDARPGAWGRAVAVRDIVLSPIPTGIGIALGADGARFAYQKLRGVRRRIDPFGLLDPVISHVRERLDARDARADEGELGFDPLGALRMLLRR